MSADHGHDHDHPGHPGRSGGDDHVGYAGPPPSSPAPPASPATPPWPTQPWGGQPWGAQPGYGTPTGYGTPSGYGAGPGQAAQAGYTTPAGYAAQPGYAAPPTWGAQPGWWTPPPPPAAWPNGPGRPQQAGTAAVLGFVAGGIAILWGLVGIVLLAGSDGGSATWLGVVVGLPAGVALIAGGTRLLAGRDRWVVVGGGAALAVAVLAQAVVSAATTYGSAFGQAFLVVLLLPVPTIAAVLAGLPVVGGWVDHERNGGATPATAAPTTSVAPPAW